jgi:polyhydroxyalkanoate synthase
VPLFAVSTVKDHVAPWRSVHKIHLVTDAEVTFVLTLWEGPGPPPLRDEPGGSPPRRKRVALAEDHCTGSARRSSAATRCGSSARQTAWLTATRRARRYRRPDRLQGDAADHERRQRRLGQRLAHELQAGGLRKGHRGPSPAARR